MADAAIETPVEEFKLVYDEFVAAEEGLREALSSTGNGYFCTRGAIEWQEADDTHYPGTYVHGVYDRATTMLAHRAVSNEDLVNLPNWLVLQLRIEGDEAITLGNIELLRYRHEYDISKALVIRELRFRDHAGRETTLRSRRFVNMAHVHQAALEWTIVPENWSGRVEVVSGLEGRVTNGNVARYGQLESHHLYPVSSRVFDPEVVALEVRTRRSRIYVAQAVRTRAFNGEHEPVDVERSVDQSFESIAQVLAFDVAQGRPTRIEKLVSLYTSREPAINEPLVAASRSVARYADFADALSRHVAAWDELWQLCDFVIPKEPRLRLLLRLHVSHILQVCSRNSFEHDAGVPARGLNGEAYRGHVFWDELYVYKFLNYRLPKVTRELLMYRYRRLGEARAAAREAGFRGAMFPWQSGSDGQEQTQVVHLNPLSGRWEPDHSHRQRHVNAAIFYNVWHFFQATGDHEFLREHGAELMLEIARFWSSIAHYNAERDRYEIHGVMGPDEFHEKYPEASEGGLRNNAYTNVMVAWIADVAQRVLELLPAGRRLALMTRLDLTDDELHRWQEMTRKMFVPFMANGIVSQFEGYEELEELDWDAYRARYPNIQRLDRILRAEGDLPDRYKVSKQADAVLLFFLFSEDELRGVFDRLGYEYSAELTRRTIDYYDERTSHGSTLSHIAFAGALATIDPNRAWERFLTALESDIGDAQHGTTKEGIHMGVMSSTLDFIQRSCAGTTVRNGVLHFEPRFTERLSGLAFSMLFRGMPMRVSLHDGRLTVATDREGETPAVRVAVGGEVRDLRAGDRWTLALPLDGGPARDIHVSVPVTPPAASAPAPAPHRSAR